MHNKTAEITKQAGEQVFREVGGGQGAGGGGHGTANKLTG